MSNFFFYTNPDLVTIQDSEQAFGPFQNGDLHKFRATNLHKIPDGENWPVVAVCDGVICAQYNSEEEINIVLKPDYQPPFDYPFVKYFLYSGIDPTSLVDNNNQKRVIPGSAPLDNDLTKRLRTNWLSSNSDLVNSYKALGLDRNASFAIKTTDGKEHKIFDGDCFIDNLFMYENEVQLMYVLRGDVIGYANTKLGFSIINDQHWQSVPLSTARNSEIVYPASETESLIDQKDPETVLNYLDPVTFLAAFQNFKLNYINSSLERKRFSDEEKKNLILTFENKHRVYVCIKHFYQFRIKPNAIELLLNDVPPLGIWPVFFFDIDYLESAKLILTFNNWDQIYKGNLEVQADFNVLTSLNETQSYLFQSNVVNYFYSNEKIKIEIEIDCEKLFDKVNNNLLATYVEIIIKDDASIDQLSELTLPPIQSIEGIRSSYLFYSYDTLFKSKTNIGFDGYEPFFKGAFFNEHLVVIFYTPVLSKHFDASKTRAFITDNYECNNVDFFETFFEKQHVFIKYIRPDDSYFFNLVSINDLDYNTLRTPNNYYEGFSAIVLTRGQYKKIREKVKSLTIPQYQITLDVIPQSGIEYFQKHQLKLLYLVDESGSPIQTVDDLSDLNITFLTGTHFENHIYVSTDLSFSENDIKYLEFKTTDLKLSRKNEPPLKSRLFTDDVLLNAINRGALLLDASSYEYFKSINHTDFVKKIFQAISIVWPEIPNASGEDRIKYLKKIWEESDQGKFLTLNHLLQHLEKVKQDINYYFDLSATKSEQKNITYFQNPLSEAIDHKLIIFLDEELNRIQLYREDGEERPLTIFNIGKASPVGKYSVTWKADAYFDYATICCFIFKKIFDDLGNAIGKIDEEMIRDYPGTPVNPSPLKLADPLMEKRIALSLILMNKLKKEKLIELGTGPTTRLTHVFYSDTKEYFFDRFYIIPNTSFYIKDWSSNSLFSSDTEYNKMIDQLFYYLIHYAVPKTEIQPDFFYHLFYYPEKLENYLADYAPKDDDGSPRQITIIESIDLFKMLETEYEIKIPISGKGLSFKSIEDKIDSIDNSQCKSFCKEVLKFESNYIKAYKDPILEKDGGEVITHLPVNQTIYLDFVSKNRWFKVRPETSKTIRKKDQIYYPHNGNYFKLEDLLQNGNPLQNGISNAPNAITRIYKVEYNYFDFPKFEAKKKIDVNGEDETKSLSSNNEDKVDIFTNNDDFVIVGHTQKFENIEFFLDTFSSESGIHPKFSYSTGHETWREFEPLDGTNGLLNNGIVEWIDTDVHAWNKGIEGYFFIKIQRTEKELTISPVANKIETKKRNRIQPYRETFNLKPSTQVPIFKNHLSSFRSLNINGTLTSVDQIKGVINSSSGTEEYQPDNSSTEILKSIPEYYLPALGSLRLTSPCPAPNSLLYKIKRHNINPPSNGEYELALRSKPEDGLLDVAMTFYGDSGVLTQFNESADDKVKKDNRFFANVIFYANNPYGYVKQPFEIFSINDGGFITNGVGLDYQNNIYGLKFTFSVDKDENGEDTLPAGLYIGKRTGIIAGKVVGPVKSYEINVNILTEEEKEENNQITWKLKSTHSFKFNWVIDSENSNSPPTGAMPEDQYNCVNDVVWIQILPVRNAAVFCKDREKQVFKSIEGNQIELINETNFAWANTELLQDNELWIPSFQHALSLASVVPDGSLGDIGSQLADYVDKSLDVFFETLDIMWPVYTGFQLDLGIGATFVYPIGIDGQFLFYILREEKSKFKIIKRGSIQAGLDASVGVGFYAGRKNKWKLRGRKSKEKHAVGGALKAEANARVMGGLYLHEEFVFTLENDSNDSKLVLLMLMSSTATIGGTAVVDSFSFLGVSPYDYMTRSKYGVFITASASAGAVAKVRLVPSTYKNEEGNTEPLPQPPVWKGVNHDPIDESNYTDKPDGFLGIILDIFGFSASISASIEVNAEFHIKLNYDDGTLDKIEIANEIGAGFSANGPSFFPVLSNINLGFEGGISFIMSGNSFRDFVKDIKVGIEKLYNDPLKIGQVHQELIKKLALSIDAMTLYTFNGELDYYDGLPARKSGIRIDLKKLANAIDLTDLKASINKDLLEVAEIFHEQRISMSLSLGMSIDHPKDFFEANRKLKKLVKYNNLNLHELNDTYKLLALNFYLGTSFEARANLKDLIYGYPPENERNGQPPEQKGIKDLINTLKAIDKCAEDKIKTKIASLNNDSDFLFFTVENFIYLTEFLNCADKETYLTIFREIIDILNWFEINNIHFINYDAVSFAFGGKLASGLKVRLDFAIEYGLIVEFDAYPKETFKPGDFLFKWLLELVLTDKI